MGHAASSSPDAAAAAAAAGAPKSVADVADERALEATSLEVFRQPDAAALSSLVQLWAADRAKKRKVDEPDDVEDCFLPAERELLRAKRQAVQGGA